MKHWLRHAGTVKLADLFKGRLRYADAVEPANFRKIRLLIWEISTKLGLDVLVPLSWLGLCACSQDSVLVALGFALNGKICSNGAKDF